MELQVGVKAFIKNDKGDYLILKRAEPFPNEPEPKWDIPGGRIVPGELILKGLEREIKEETGLVMTGDPKIIYAQDILRIKDKHVVRLTYEAQAKGEVKINPQEHSEYKWATIREFKKILHDKYLDPIFKILGG